MENISNDSQDTILHRFDDDEGSDIDVGELKGYGGCHKAFLNFASSNKFKRSILVAERLPLVSSMNPSDRSISKPRRRCAESSASFEFKAGPHRLMRMLLCRTCALFVILQISLMCCEDPLCQSGLRQGKPCQPCSETRGGAGVVAGGFAA